MNAIQITDEKTIERVQQEFREQFPYLKIEFYEAEHSTGQGSPEALRVHVEKTIGEVRLKHENGHLNIRGNLKVSALEQAFHDTFGLNVQVFRKSGSLWLQTTATDDWTLREQNETAKDFSLDEH
jgi:hypothetical protein